RLLLDLGSGAIGPLQRIVDPRELDAVLVTHLHGDHYLDLCALHVALRYHPDGSSGRHVEVHGPRGTARAVGQASGASPAALGEHLAFQDVRPGRFALGPFTVTAARAAHP